MWQKARVIKSNKYPETIGLTLWVRCQPPRLCTSVVDALTGERKDPGKRFFLNLQPRHPASYAAVMSPDNLELLPEFAEDVPLISWEEFLHQGTNGQGEVS